MSEVPGFLGMVENGRFAAFAEGPALRAEIRLTRLPVQAARPPETDEIELGEHEGRVVLVRGHDSGGWIYSAELVEVAGPILSLVARRVFGGTA